MTDEMHELERRLAASMTSAMTTAAEAVARTVLTEFQTNVKTLAMDALHTELRTIKDILTSTANAAAEAVELVRQLSATMPHVLASLTQLQGQVIQLQEEHNRCPGCRTADAA
jgi:hypothetical protein